MLLLGALLFTGVFSTTSIICRAQSRIAFRPDSPLAKFFTGRLRALLRALVFTAIATPVLAWQALRLDTYVVAGLLALCFVSSLLSLWIEARAKPHLAAGFDRAAAVKLAGVLPLILFIPLLGWLNWTYVSIPVAMLTAPLAEATLIVLAELPPRAGWLNEVLAFFFAVDAAKLWLTFKLGETGWAPIFYSLDAALVAIIVAHASARLTSLVKPFTQRPQA
ncbi:MAG: hypothetical protein WD046_12240 [Paracoccaceae bacterium]